MTPPPQPPRKKRRLFWLLIPVFFIFFVLVGAVLIIPRTQWFQKQACDHRSFLFNAWLWIELKTWYQNPEIKAARERLQYEATPSSRDLAAITDLKLHSASLPACPLIYPLLDENGKVNLMGSYLSLSAMRQASFLPQSVFCSIYGAGTFTEFGLFNENDPSQKYYYTQLPYYFQNPKDLCEGTLVPVKKGWKIEIRFWGTQPEKKFVKVFKTGKLRLAPGWMAACLHEYMGFHPTKSEAAYRDKPMFTSDEDMDRAAGMEPYLNASGGGTALVTGWDTLLAKNPDNPYLFTRWLQIRDARGDGGHFAQIAQMVQQQPDASLLTKDLISEMYYASDYGDCYALSMKELSRDNNNSDIYFYATQTLWNQHYKSAAIELAKTWTELHPDNPEAWYRLMRLYKDWADSMIAWNWERFIDPADRKAMIDKASEGMASLDQAAKLFPNDARVWATYLEFGSEMAFDKPTMDLYLGKMMKLNPYDKYGIESYSDYLWPQRYGSTPELEAFDKEYDLYDPGLYSGFAESIWRVLDNYGCTVEGREAFLKVLQAKIKAIPMMPEFEASLETYLTFHPADLDMWHNYFLWEISGERQGHPFEFAQKISGLNPLLPGLGPTLVLAFDDEYKKNLLYDPDENWLYDQRSDIVARSEKAYEDLAAIEPQNWAALNRLAFYAYKHRDFQLTKKTLDAIGTHWAGEVWPEEIFDKAKKMTAYDCLDCAGTGAASCGAVGCVHGYIRCPNHCLQVEEGDWIHMHVDGHSDTDIWKKYNYFGGGYEAFSQAHVGRLITLVNGRWTLGEICPLCHGTGWIKCPACHAANKCDTCHGTGKQEAAQKL